MKKFLLVAIVALCTKSLYGQYSPFYTVDSIDINKVNAWVTVHGDMWLTVDTAHTANYSPKCIFPKDSLKSVFSEGGIWISGYDADDQLHIAAQTYRDYGIDYWPGPLTTSAPSFL